MAMEKNYGNPELEEKLRDRSYETGDSSPDFMSEIERIGRTNAHMCFQCGTCTGGCPSAPRSSYRIRLFMRRGVLGLEEEAINDPDLWLCTTCYSCSDRCPRDIAPTDVIMAMRNISFLKYDKAPRNFLKSVQAMYAYGHVVPNNETNMAARVKLGLPANPPTVHSYPEYLTGIQKILDHYGMKEKSDRLLSESE